MDFRPGDLVEALDLLEERLRGMLADGLPDDVWHGLLTQHHEPLIQQLWCKQGEFRLRLVRMYPCEKPQVFHHIPYPMAAKIVKGSCEVQAAYVTEKGFLQKTGSVFHMSKGATLEVLSPADWFSLRPVSNPVYVVVVTGKPFPKKVKTVGLFQRGLETQEKRDLGGIFRVLYVDLKDPRFRANQGGCG